MIIKSLTLHNFGVYSGTNTFQFRNERPVVLIGGLNGRGKTTFLEAILIALYGTNSFAYKESVYSSYGGYLRAHVNESDQTHRCFIELEFVMSTDDFNQDSYLVHREWNSANKRIKEEISVKKNGIADEFLTSNWPMFVESILPSALSNFFFFDGEKIAELAVSETDENLKDSIRSLLGVTILDRLKRDLIKQSKKKRVGASMNAEETLLAEAADRRAELESELASVNSQIIERTEELSKIQSELEAREQDYIIQGGDLLQKKESLYARRSDVLGKINLNKELLLNMAASELPLALVRDLMETVEIDAKKEQEEKEKRRAAELFQRIMDNYGQSDSEELNRFADFVKGQLASEDNASVYNLSDHSILQLQELNDHKLEQKSTEAKELMKEESDLQNQKNTVDDYLSVDVNEHSIQETIRLIRDLEARKTETTLAIEALEEQRKTLEWNCSKANAEYLKLADSVLSNIELKDDAERILKYSHMAISVLDEYTIRLQRDKTGMLSETITDCYHRLANKRNMIDHVVMDPVSLDITYLNQEGKEVPKSTLSAGEKQLMVIAILWALAICSKRKLPVIIDTPLSRLDSEHRKALVTTYFPQASEQAIILSTDSEVDQYYYSLMKPNVGDEYTLIYDDATRSTSVVEGYFAGEPR